jgi:hypothetical protein
MIVFVAALAFWVLAWGTVLARWQRRRIESDTAALLVALSLSGILGLYSLARQHLDLVLVLVLVGFAVFEYLIGRSMLRRFEADRPTSRK